MFVDNFAHPVLKKENPVSLKFSMTIDYRICFVASRFFATKNTLVYSFIGLQS